MGGVIDWKLATTVAEGIAGPQARARAAAFEHVAGPTEEAARLVSAYTGLRRRRRCRTPSRSTAPLWIQANLTSLQDRARPGRRPARRRAWARSPARSARGRGRAAGGRGRRGVGDARPARARPVRVPDPRARGARAAAVRLAQPRPGGRQPRGRARRAAALGRAARGHARAAVRRRAVAAAAPRQRWCASCSAASTSTRCGC